MGLPPVTPSPFLWLLCLALHHHAPRPDLELLKLYDEDNGDLNHHGVGDYVLK